MTSAPTPVADLLERADDLSTLAETVEAVAETGRGRLVLVSGEAGVGKTALLRRFCSEQDARVLWGDCDPLFTPRPLGPLFAVAEEAGGAFQDIVARGVLPHEVAAALADELRSRRPTVFVLEDLHWADEATLDVVRLLCRRLESLPVVVIGSFRDDDLDLAPLLRIVLGEVGTSDRATRLRVAPLSPAAVAELAEPHAVDADELYRKTAGNPFFVVEAIAAGGDEVPDTVRDAVLARAAHLSAAARNVLCAVAVTPPHAELWLLDALVGEEADALDECLTAGVLRPEGESVAFRHELARLVVEDAVPLQRRLELHRAALSALAGSTDAPPDLARLAHHAEAAGDGDAVLWFAPAAGERAAALGAHREAAAQYARALRFGDRLDVTQRAELLERRSRACYLTDQYDEGIEALEQAVELRRSAGDKLKEGDDLRRLAEFFWCPGRVPEAERAAAQAVTLLEALRPSRELAAAYGRCAFLCACGLRREEAIAWAERAFALAEQVGDTEIMLDALSQLRTPEGVDAIEEVQERSRAAGLTDLTANLFVPLAGIAVERHLYAAANRYLHDGLDYCGERGYELFRLYLLAIRARFELDQGRWSDAADTAASVIRVPRTSTTPRIGSLVVLGLVRARRGDPGHSEMFYDALALADPTAELLRIGPVATARAEAAWLRGDHDGVREATDDALRLAVELDSPIFIGELATWRRRAGLDGVAARAAGPYALELAGEPARAANRWRELGCPYDAAVALAQSNDSDDLQRAYDELLRLEAQPAARIVAQRLRERGARVSRGPRPSTRENPANLTAREVEVLTLVAQGLRNADVAKQLFLSEKTVGHHVSAILRKLDVRTRGEAGAEGARLGILQQHGPT